STNCCGSIKSACRASTPNSRLRSVSMAGLGNRRGTESWTITQAEGQENLSHTVETMLNACGGNADLTEFGRIRPGEGMDTSTRYLVALSVWLPLQILLGSTVLFLVRRYKHVEPPWSWLRIVGAYVLLCLLVGFIGLVPVVGKPAALIATLFGVKRLTGLDVLSTFILSFLMGLACVVLAALMGVYFQVDLLGLEDK